jgi:putative phosphoserine phosphatase/1-acylglycerol-3-phosphate O-acyltransferase
LVFFDPWRHKIGGREGWRADVAADAQLNEILDDIETSAEGPEVGAIFDYDGTLIAGFSAFAFVQDQIMSGAMSPRDFVEQVAAAGKFAAGRTGFSAFVGATAGSLRGRAESWFEEIGEKVYKNQIAGAVYPESRAIVDAHQRKGHTVAIVSSATKYQIRPVADDLGIDHVLCTELEVRNGVFTGEVVRPTCFGEGKRLAAEKLAEKTGLNIFDSFFYTDSDDDLPLLEVVGRPRILNPNRKLAAIARQRSWRTYRFTSRGRPDLLTIARTAASYAAMPAAFAAAAPVWALSGDKRDMLNTAIGMWADYAAAITGLRLHIEGEEHLWSHRPAVFIFNHQSSADALIAAKLVRRDFTGVGKKEIARFPVVGPLMKFGDVVFIDRSNRKAAIESMKAVVRTMREDGLSVVIAPEGTRSASTKLGAFKKGPFHIAIEAGAPIVPIVIHNAVDALPRGQNLVRPADVRVTVLAPIPTADWTKEGLDARIEEIRNMFLRELDQGGYDDDLSLDHWDMPDGAGDDDDE